MSKLDGGPTTGTSAVVALRVVHERRHRNIVWDMYYARRIIARAPTPKRQSVSTLLSHDFFACAACSDLRPVPPVGEVLLFGRVGRALAGRTPPRRGGRKLEKDTWGMGCRMVLVGGVGHAVSEEVQ